MPDFEALIQEIQSCTRCALSQKRTRTVPGEGSLAAAVVFIGEGPGYHEDKQGRPFVGAAGQFLDELLESIGLKREDVYITNMIKCRAPNNRDPLPAEIQACRPYLDKQLEMIGPKVLVTLGRHSFSRFFPGESIGKARGQARRMEGLVVYPMYHPAAALHNPKLRSVIESDFKKLPDLVKRLEEDLTASERDAVSQLSLF